MKLYHLSFDIEQPLTRTFIPRVPAITLDNEDASIPRICCSESVLGCINALPNFDDNLCKTWDDYECSSKAVLFSFDTDNLVSPENSLLTSQDLYSLGLVDDALINQECWILSPVTMVGEVVDLLPNCDRCHWLYSSKEYNREFIYGVIDKVCDGYATTHRAELDKFSLFYILNYYFYDIGLDVNKACALDFEFCDIADSFVSPRIIDGFIVFPDFYVNGTLVTLKNSPVYSLREMSEVRKVSLEEQVKAASRLVLQNNIERVFVRKELSI